MIYIPIFIIIIILGLDLYFKYNIYCEKKSSEKMENKEETNEETEEKIFDKPNPWNKIQYFTHINKYFIKINNNMFKVSRILSSTNINTVDVLCNGQNDGSAEITFQIDNYPNSYGTESLLSYCTSNPGTNTFSNIKDVQLTGDNISINNNTSGLCDSYEDYTSQYADLTQGQSYTLYVSTGDCNGFNFPSGTGFNYSGGTAPPSLPGNPYTYKR